MKPHFKMLWKDMVPVVREQDDEDRQTSIDVVAGQYKDSKAPDPTPESWAADPEHGVTILTIKMEPEALWTLPGWKNDEVNRTLYFYRGDAVKMNGKEVKNNHSVSLNPSADIQIKNSTETAFLLLLQGKPIHEPVAQHGPFVMNTQNEIQEAFEEYRKTEFGGWPWPRREQVHEREKGRFALYADGREEKAHKSSKSQAES